METKVFILTNKTSEKYFKIFLKKSFGKKEAEVIVSESDLYKITESRANLETIIILAELDWKDEKDHFYGFEIAVELRRKYKLLCQIIIISMMAGPYFEKLASDNIKYKILFSRGIAFLPLTRLYKQLHTAIESLCKYPLSEAVLADMNEMLIDQKGVVIDKLTHDLQFNKLGNNVAKLEAVLNETSAYLTNIQLNTLNWMDFQKQLLENISDVSKFNTTADKLIKECERTLVSDTKPPEAKQYAKHKILVIDDDPDFRKKIEENLNEYFEELILTGNAEEAIEKIKEDGTNQITGIIADWRLYANFKEKTYWQLQGYELLDFAAKNHFIALFTLTSLSDYNVNNIRNALGLDIHLFKKQHLETQDSKVQWEMMVDTMRQKCDAIVEIIASQPTGDGWKKLQQEYIVKRAVGWSSFENEISQEATRILNYYIDAIKINDERNVYSVSELGVVLKNNLKNILITRRVFMGIYFTLVKANNYLQEVNRRLLGDGSNFDTELKHHTIDTHSLLRKDWWDDLSTGLDSTKVEAEWGKFEQRMKNLRGTLCIELTELPALGILPEEKHWLAKNNIDYSFLFNYWQISD